MKLTISVAELVGKEVLSEMERSGYNNKSEFVEELIRLGLVEWKKRDS